MTTIRTTAVLAMTAVAFALAPVERGHAQVANRTDVPVVRNPPAAEAPVLWTIDPEPVVEIGASLTNPKQQLFQVVDAARLSDGRIVIANAGSYELRFYTADGRYISAVGGEGGGPGEFRSFSSFQVGAHDSIYVYDSELGRLTVFNGRGDRVRIARVPMRTHSVGGLQSFRDGRWYAIDGSVLVRGPAGTIQRDTAHFLLYGSDLRFQSIIAAVPGIMTAFPTTERFGTGIAVAPFTPRPVYDDFGNCLYLSSGDDFQVLIFSSGGELVRAIRNAGERRPATSEDFAAWIEYKIAEQNITDPRRLALARKLLRAFPRPDMLPTYNDLIVDSYGYIWLQRYSPPDGTGRWWTVLSPRGELLGRVRMPVALEVYDIGRDYVLGEWEDELGREIVRLYRLDRDGGPAVPSLAACAAS